MSQSKFQKMVMFIIVAGFTIYIAFQIFSADFSKYELDTAEKATVNDSINTTGFIFRNEAYVFNDTPGAISYELSDGDAVNKGGTIANIFSDESQAVAYRQSKELRRSIENLTLLSKDENSVAMNLDTVNNLIEDKIINLLSDINSRSYIDIDETKSSLISSINQRQHIIGAENGYEGQIQSLQSKLSALEAGVTTIGSVTASESGYFVSVCDGYESSVNCENIADLTLDELDSLRPDQLPASCVGKIIRDYKWYIAAKITAEQALVLSQTDYSLTVSMPFASNKEIPVTVEQVNQHDRMSDGVVILSCGVLNEDLVKTRKEPIQINLRTVSGLKIPKKAIHDSVVEIKNDNGEVEKKTVQGVYVITGQRIDFKEILITYSGSDYVLCAYDPDEEQEKLLATGSTILLHDQIIVEGADIYDGKVIE